MLCYNRIDISKEPDIAKNNNSKECMVFHYCFFNPEFKYYDSVSNCCHI